MARINRIQCVNFLRFTNKKGTEKSRDWKPAYRDIVFKLHCATSAIVVLNGHGKTSLAHFFFHLLTRRDFRSTVSSRSAPRSFGAPTHFRVELGIFDHEHLAQREIDETSTYLPPSKTVVFGMWCFRGDDPHFYYYEGKLEDCPVTHIGADGRLTYLDETAVRECLLRMPEYKSQRSPWIADKEEWRERVGAYIDRRWLAVQVKFHQKGAGDKSADLQSVRQYGNERFDEAFFRMVVAPELLANLKGDEAEEDEVYVEDSLFLNYKALSGAEFECEDAGGKALGLDSTLNRLRPVLTKSQAFEAAKSTMHESAIDFTSDIALLHHLVVRNPIDGLLSRRNPPVGAAQDLLDYLYVDERHDFRILDAGLAILSGLDLAYVNRRAGEKYIIGKIRDENSQVIDFACNFKLNDANFLSFKKEAAESENASQAIDFACNFKFDRAHGGRRGAHQAYSFDQATGLLEALSTNPKFRGDVAVSLATLQQAFSWAQTTGDTNCFRTRLSRLKRELHDLVLKENAANEQKSGFLNELEVIKTRVDLFEHAKVAYEKTKASGLFSVGELSSPQSTADALAGALNEKNTQVALFSTWLGTWESQCKAYDDFVTQHDGQTPYAVLALLKNAIDVATEMSLERERMRGAAQQKVSDCTTQWNGARQTRNKAVARLDHAERLHIQAIPFKELFGELPPAQIDVPKSLRDAQLTRDQLLPAHAKHTADCHSIRECMPLAMRYVQIFGTESTTIAAQAPARHRGVAEDIQRIRADRASVLTILCQYRRFSRIHPGQEPTQWLADRDEKLRHLAIDEHKAGVLLANALREHKELQDNPAAATQIAAEALNIIRNQVDFEEVHQVIARACTDDEIRECWLTAFSSLLHAPVVRNSADALAAATLLNGAKYPIPVFVSEKLVSMLMKMPPPTMTDDAMAEWIFAGLKTRAVECILNPQRLEEERRAAAERVTQARQECTRLAQLKDELAERAPAVVLAREASKAEGKDLPVKCGKLRTKQRALETTLEALKVQASAQAQALIDPRRRFDVLLNEYGADAEHVIEHQYEECAARLREIDTTIQWWNERNSEEARTAVHAAKELHELGEDGDVLNLRGKVDEMTVGEMQAHARLEHATSTLETALSEEASAKSKHTQASLQLAQRDSELQRLIAIRQSDHYERMQGMEKEQSTLRQAQQDAQLRLEFKELLSNAEPYTQRLGQSVDEDTQRTFDINGQVIQLDLALKNIGELTYARRQTILETEAFATDLHEIAVIIRNQAHILESSSHLPLVEQAYIHPIEIHPLYRAGDELRIALSSGNAKNLAAHIARLREAAGILNCRETTSVYMEAAKRTQRAAKDFSDGLASLMKAHERHELGGVSPLAFESLQGSPSSELIGAVLSALETDRDQCESLLVKAKTSIEKAREMVKDSLIKLAQGAGDNLTLLQHAMKTTKDATFEVEAAIAPTEIISEGWETIYKRIKLRLSRQRTDGRSLSALAMASREEETLKDEIRNEVLSLLFINTAVEFQHPSLTEGMVALDLNEYSEGQKAAINLMWIAKLAEYKLLQVMQAPGLPSMSNSRFKKVMRKTDYFLWIDGLFSNLSSDELIEPSMQSLRHSKDHFQLIGWIHNQNYINNYDIFPVSISGRLAARKAEAKVGDYIMLEHEYEPGSMALFTSRLDPPPGLQ